MAVAPPSASRTPLPWLLGPGGDARIVEAAGPWDQVVTALEAAPGPVAVVADRADLVPALLGRPEAPVVLVPPPTGQEPFDAQAARGVGLVVVEVPVPREGLLPLSGIADLRAEGFQVGVRFVDGRHARTSGLPLGEAEQAVALGWETGALVALVGAGIRTVRGADVRAARQTLATLGALAEGGAAAAAVPSGGPGVGAPAPGPAAAPVEPRAATSDVAARVADLAPRAAS